MRLHWVARGEGPPPVVLHGNGSLAQDVLLGDFAARAGRRHRVVIFDRPGHGRSTRPRGRSFPPGEQARLLAQALDALGVRRPLLLGHSRGARVAVAWALQRPREVRGLLLEGGTFHPTPRLDVRLAAGLAVPVALVCGGDRMVDPRTQSVACHRRLPDATLTLVPDCGHVVHHTAPAALLDALDALDRRCAPHPLPGAPDLWAGRRVLPRPRRPGPGARPPPRSESSFMAAKTKTLQDAFYETLKDVYYAERQSVRALKKSARAAENDELRQAFERHAEESAEQVERLQQVFEILGKPARGKTCEAMQGLTSEMEEDLEDFGGGPAADAVLVGCAQAVEHYEIARYGTLKTWAAQLGYQDAAKLLDETLQEEKRTDQLLTEIAGRINQEGAGDEPGGQDRGGQDGGGQGRGGQGRGGKAA